MIGVTGFVARVEKIAERKLTYRTGGIGKDGTCDCIGLVMGAMYESGRNAYDLHSTNYFARFQIMELKRVSKRDLFIGQILFHARTNQDKLNGRYLPGGRYYTGDLLDYYHVSVVTSVNPLRIVECTEYGDVSGIVVNETFKGWDYGGKLRGVLYDETESGGVYEKEEEMSVVLYEAEVITKEDPLTIRATPNGRKIGEIPKGANVEVLADGEWARVRYGEMLGYVSSQYLKRIEAPENMITVSADVTIIDSEGNTFKPVGDWRVLIGSVD